MRKGGGGHSFTGSPWLLQGAMMGMCNPTLAFCQLFFKSAGVGSCICFATQHCAWDEAAIYDVVFVPRVCNLPDNMDHVRWQG